MPDRNTIIKCFHCSEPVPEGLDLTVEIFGKKQHMCCAGCQAIARTIMDYGHQDYYKYRTRFPDKPGDLVPENLRKLQLFDLPDIQKKFVQHHKENIRETSLILDGVTCPACVWMIERHISILPGVVSANVNYSNNRAAIVWDNSRIKLSDIMEAVSKIGYSAYPYEPGREQYLAEDERKKQIRRIGLAGLLGMQVMMISVALYIGEWKGIDHTTRKFFQWFAFLLATPVLFYSAQPFFRGAWRNIRQLYAGMDIPVTVGLLVAYTGSIWATVTDIGDVYYDTVVMFIFFLSISRYLEFSARRKSIQHIENLNRILPAMATRLDNIEGTITETFIPVAELKSGDLVLVRAGETVPADGIVYDGKSTVDESLITGENLPIVKNTGTEVIGGSINIESPLQVRVTNIGENTLLSRILYLIDHARSEKPAFTQTANMISGWFVISVLIIAVIAVIYWWNAGQEIWLPITISVLVATCPCALAIATPAALSAAITTYLKAGIAVSRQTAVEELAKVTHFIFDKTGTLTYGNLKLDSINCLSNADKEKFLAIAAALEASSEHPVGKAIVEACNAGPYQASNINNFPGEGITGIVENEQYYLGTQEFISKNTGLIFKGDSLETIDDSYKTAFIMANSRQLCCTFVFSDEIRPHAKQLIKSLKENGIKTILLSGDKRSSVKHIADTLKTDIAVSDLKPDKKLAWLETLRDRNSVIAMLGDGINDAPVLAAADVSLAMGSGTSISRINADVILLNNDLEVLEKAIKVSRKTFKIIRQNIIWAIGYNILILPAAFAGIIQPWIAAIGMSLSSLIVVGNASRIKPWQENLWKSYTS